jgi:hypothetical protein
MPAYAMSDGMEFLDEPFIGDPPVQEISFMSLMTPYANTVITADRSRRFFGNYS